MKKLLLLVGVAALLATTTQAQDTNPPSGSTKDRIITFVQDTSTARSLVLAVYPSYAPELAVNGEKDRWGFGAAALYPIPGDLGQYSYVGLRIDWLGSSWWAPSATVGLKADVQLFGVTMTPMVYTGGVVPISGAGDQNGDWGYIVGGGMKARVWKGTVFGKEASLDLAAAAEKWSQFDGNVYHIAPVFRISW